MNARRRVDALRQRGWRAAADARRVALRRGSASSALESLGNPHRQPVADWNAATQDRHDAYRRAHDPATGSVAALCVSMRPHLLTRVVENLERQAGVDVDVVFVANAPDFDLDAVDRALAPLANSRVVQAPPSTSLGAALNLGLDATDARFVAKIDDDDFYGPQYLSDALRAHRFAGAGVVGKHSYYAQIVDTANTYLRFPGNEFRYSSTLAGGTLVIDRDEVGEQRFDDISLGEDRAFLARCHRRGIATFSADRFNFTQERGDANTWRLPVKDFLVDAIAADGEEAFR